MTFRYRMTLYVAYLGAAGIVMYLGCQEYGQGWLLLGWPFAMIAGFAIQTGILRTFPPKLEAYAEGDTWIKLN